MYSGFLAKVGSYTIPFKFIVSKSYKCGIKGQDLDSYTNANGILIRNALTNKSIKLEFETGKITEKKNRELLDHIIAEYNNTTEKRALVTAYMPEIGKYVTMQCYVPDIEYTVEEANEKGLSYENVRLAFIGYGGKVE